MIDFAVFIDGLETVRDLQDKTGRIDLNVVRALNTTARDKRARSARLIQGQINLPKSYLSPSGGRLTVAKKATRSDKSAIIRARGRPTSLARYAVNPTFNKAGVRLRVKPGQSSYLRRAFLIRLPGRGGDTETQANAGLAIRLRPGERLQNKIAQVKLSNSLYLLYGPSVQQVFLDNQGGGVADDITDETLRDLEREFLRLMKL